MTTEGLLDASERHELEQLRLATRLSGSVWSFELGEHDLTSANATVVHVRSSLGYERQEVPTELGKMLAFIIVPEDQARVLADVQACIDGKTETFETEYRVHRKDGALQWNLARGTTVRDADGRPIRLTGSSIEITHLKQVEEALRESEQRFRRTFENAAVGMILTDPSGRFLEYNARFCEFLGYSRDELAGRHFSEFMVPEELETDLVQQRRVVRGELPWFTRDKRYLRKDCATVWGNITVSVIQRLDDGTPVRVLGILQDITERKALEGELRAAREAAEAANHAKDEFLANVSHEIRTPMNAILGMTELALDSAPSDRQKRLLSTVHSAAKSLLTIINDLLDFSKITSGKLTLDRAEFSLRGAVGDTLRSLAVRAHRKGLELVCHVRPDVPDTLEGDAGRLRQVLMNLVGNAIKFTARGEVEVEVGAEMSSESPEVNVIITVRDTGIGIARDKQAAIFRAFEQADSSTTRKYGGTGLGLTISAQLASLMGGDITVQSAAGCGSTFRFTARFDRSSRRDSAATSTERLANLRVLVAEPHETNRRILVEWLTSWRMRPTAVNDAGGALAALASAHDAGTPFAVVLLDSRMPDLDGVPLASQIRRRWEAPPPRVVLLSSNDGEELAARSRERGVHASLLKPVQESELLEAIWAVMNLDLTQPGAAAHAEPPHRRRALRVLVAEDNELNVALLRELLGKRGHHAQFAHNGRAALELALSDSYDLLLLDLHMPELDGFEVVHAIREHERGTHQHLRIIALTARSSARDRERCLAAGMDEFLAKPIETAALWAAMDRLMAGSFEVTAPDAQSVERGLLDARAILRACGGRATVLETLCVVFQRSMPGHLARVRTKSAAGDLRGLREAAHQLAGTVAAFSTTTAAVASALEDAAARGDGEVCAALVGELGPSCNALLDATVGLSIESLSR